ncbi:MULTISPECIES: alcohol dehydrogenase [unclassified Beijerinckia]|uniref:alcohol dehydrogenase n=1 Tax=unclassified Beijerinckia TaxID=2638183 RepID=UPI00089AF265|nr:MULTISPECIES: alcohol dehydrogenase [unclassified Beijerinckia]MDH7797730.1 D-arabinose 1-dehydrogenase-like Zn-dependent alcohol dehydrogenase [Beijerinckia sp. GAS462]SEC96606.1 alcohol dehydrogenase/alcohol dehydrogenase, propanol-preferring [Beijerinckia sp. 28-YEA-48]
MKKLAITQWGEPLQLLEAETPAPQGREVLVKTQACGVCHSDVHVWDGYFDMGAKGKMRMADRGMKLPFTLGHEIVATVAALGPEASGATIGQSYIVYPWIGCGTCTACRADNELMCVNARSLGLRCDGGYADHVVVPDAKYLVPYDGLSRDVACTYACSGITAYSALKKVQPRLDSDWICIIGCGGLGIGAIRISKAISSARILAIDVSDARLDLAKAAGADMVVNSSAADVLSQIQEITGGGAHATIDFVGSGETFSLAVDTARRGGQIVIVGLFGGSTTIAPLAITTKLLRIEGSYVGTLQDLKDLVALAQTGKLPPIATVALPYERASEALNALKQGKGGEGRAVLQFN